MGEPEPGVTVAETVASFAAVSLCAIRRVAPVMSEPAGIAGVNVLSVMVPDEPGLWAGRTAVSSERSPIAKAPAPFAGLNRDTEDAAVGLRVTDVDAGVGLPFFSP